jgi:hypothetical protein
MLRTLSFIFKICGQCDLTEIRVWFMIIKVALPLYIVWHLNRVDFLTETLNICMHIHGRG